MEADQLSIEFNPQDVRSKIAHNARRLLKDAEILLRNESYASATALSVIAIEEVGKIFLSLKVSSHNSTKRISHALRGHFSKQKAIGNIVLVQCFVECLGEELVIPPTSRGSVIHIPNSVALLLIELVEKKFNSSDIDQALHDFSRDNDIKRDSGFIRRNAEQYAQLLRGDLSKIKNSALYCDIDTDDNETTIRVDQHAAETMFMLARQTIRMCKEL